MSKHLTYVERASQTDKEIKKSIILGRATKAFNHMRNALSAQVSTLLQLEEDLAVEINKANPGLFTIVQLKRDILSRQESIEEGVAYLKADFPSKDLGTF